MSESDILTVLRRRWSPRAFDAGHTLGPADVDLLLEAARWAPSAGNSQPWAFHAAIRGSASWRGITAHLTGSSRPWATEAAALVVNLAHVRVEDTDWEYSEFAMYDLGQAVAHMTIQAHSMGLSCRQFRAFDKERLAASLDVPEHWEIVTMTAVGRPAPTARRDGPAATRQPDITWPTERRADGNAST